MRTAIAYSLLITTSCCYAIEQNASVKPSIILQTSSSWDGTLLNYPTGQAQITGMKIEIAVGGETGWHQHPSPSFGIVLAGELEITLRSGQSKRLKPGDTFAEVVNTEHNGRNISSVPVNLLVFYAGSVEQPLSIKERKE